MKTPLGWIRYSGGSYSVELPKTSPSAAKSSETAVGDRTETPDSESSVNNNEGKVASSLR